MIKKSLMTSWTDVAELINFVCQYMYSVYLVLEKVALK